MATATEENKNLRYFEVQGTYVVRATSQKEALEAVRRSRPAAPSKVLSSDLSATRISATRATEASTSGS